MNLPVAAYLGMLYFASEFVLGLVKRSRGSSSAPADRGSIRLLWVIIPICMFLGFQFEFGWREAGWPPQPWINALGIAVTLAGLALRWYAIIYLGRFFTVNVAIAHDHELIDSGPYRRLRHPSYTGALLAFLGLALCTQNWASLAVIMVGTTAAFSYRIRVEEAALAGAFGDKYRQYMQRTWRLVPGIY